MEYGTFREWLTQQGCSFDAQHRGRGEGHGVVIIHREGRTAELPLVGLRQELDEDSVREVCKVLDLKWSDLPGPKSHS